MISADILTIVIALLMALGTISLIVGLWKWARVLLSCGVTEPRTHGDEGGWPAYGLKHLDGHPRGRVEVTGRTGGTSAPEIGSGLLAGDEPK